MKNGTAIQTPFQLVGREHQAWDDATDHAHRTPHLLQPYDPRWVFAVRAAQELERAAHAVISDEARERIIRQASGMGLSRFDALSIISIVAGEAAAGHAPLGAETECRLSRVGGPITGCSKGECGIPMALAAAITAVVMGVFAYFALML